MAFTLTVQQVRESSIRNIAGQCANSDAFTQTLNEVTQRLMKRGGFWGLEVLMRLCFQGCTVVWPRVVGTVLGLRFCCSGTATIYNNHWAIWGYRTCDNWAAGWRGDVVVRDDGTRPCTSEISGTTGKYLRLHIVKQQDIGKQIRVFGFQFGNQPLQELDSDGNWRDGITIVATQADTTTTILVTKITNVIKEETQGRMWLYSVHPTTGDLELLSMYENNETNPAYRASVIQNFQGIPFHADSSGRRMRQVEALVKLQFVPAVADDDFVLIDDLEALKNGFQAFRLEEADDDAGAEIKWTKAIRSLNAELRDREPGLQTVVRVNSISSNWTICNPI